MCELIVGQIYIGQLHKRLVIYKGYQMSHDCPELGFLHQFEYLVPDKVILGYGQSDAQILPENYTLCKVETVLYGTNASTT